MAAAASRQREPRDPALRSRHHQGREVRRRHLHRPPHRGPRLLRDPERQARTRVPLGQPDRQDDARRRLRRPGRRQPRREMGAPRRPHPAARASRTTSSPIRRAPIAKAVEAANNNPIVMAFNVEAEARTATPVIEVTRLFTTDVPEFSGRTRVGARTFDASRSFVDRAVSFPENIEVEATHTYNNPPAEAGAGGRGGPAPGGRGGAPPLRSGQPQCRHALQHGAAAREADAGAAVRRARRLLLDRQDRLQRRTSTARRSAASSPAGGSRRRTRTRRCRSR